MYAHRVYVFYKTHCNHAVFLVSHHFEFQFFPADNAFFQWWNTVSLNQLERRDVTISLLNEAHEPTMVWKISNAWPAKITGTDMKADGNEIAIETIELAHEGLSIQNE